MKKLLKRLSVLFAVILAVSVFAFADEVEEEKTYIVYPKEEIALFSADENAPEYMVIGEEELNMLLEEAPEMIDWYEENIKGELFWNTYDEVYTDDYNLPKYELDVINVASVWEKGYYGDKIRVAVVDSGLYSQYEGTEFLNVIPGKDYTSSKTTNDTFGHGTQVTGMIAASHNGVLVKGISPNVEIVPLKVTNDGNVYTVEVSQAIRDAVDIYDCDVINLSLGFPGPRETLKNAVDYAVGKGVTVVAAVGNYKNGNNDKSYVEKDFMEESTLVLTKDDSLQYPAAYDNVIGVGAVHRWYGFLKEAERVSPISKQNSSVLITAPGERVITTHLPYYIVDKGGNSIPQFCYYSYGTSFSAPLVTGAVALLKQANPDLTPAEIMSILAESATDDAKGDGYDTAYGHGILNVEAAIELVLDENRAPSTVTYRVTADDEALSDAITVENYTIGNIGSHPLGTSFTAKAEPTYTTEDGTTYKFAYWVNGNGTYVSGETPYTFIATSNFTLRAVYDKVVTDETATTEKKVEFWNGNGILLGTEKVDTTTGQVASIPEKAKNPTMTGYAFDRWLDEDENEFSADSILKKNLTRVVAQFKDAATEYSITFDDATDTDTKETGAYGEKVTYTATGDSFDYWTLGDEIVSYNPTIEIALWGADKKLTAVYDAENFDVEPTVVLDTGADEANFLIYSVPDDYKIVDAGIVFGKSDENPRVASFRSKASVKKLPENGFGQFTSLPGGEEHTKARGYLIYKDPDNVTRVIYAD